jgi:L-2,4-diaminobutyrate decarboxylase
MEEPLFFNNDPLSQQAYRQAIMRAAEVLLKAMPKQPCSGATPEDLRRLFPDAPDADAAQPAAEVDAELARIIAHSVQPSHPHTAAHLHCPVLIPALAAEVVLTALNQSMDSFDQAPAATIIEERIIRWLCELLGWPTVAGGTFTAGGTLSNYTGLLLARDHFGQARWNWPSYEKGLPPESRRYRFLCSEAAHFSVEKSAIQLGLGTQAVRKISVDAKYRMRVDALEQAVREITAAGDYVVAIVATAGTTDFGSIDPLQEIARVARAAGAWLHVDAAYGGALLFAPEHRAMLQGIELADSVSLDFHKLLWMPVSCAAFLVRDEALFDPIKWQSDYLNPESHEELGIPDLVTKSLQTTRRFDALKVWLAFRAIGRQRMAELIDRCLDLAGEVAELIRRDGALELLNEPELTSIVFRLRAGNDAESDRLNEAVRHALFNSGHAVVGHTVVSGRNYLKFTLLNPTAKLADYAALLEKIHACAKKLAPTAAIQR